MFQLDHNEEVRFGLGSVCYFLKEGFRNVWMNGFMSVASILVMVCCFLFIGVSFFVSENIKSTLKTIEGQNSITIYLNSNLPKEECMSIEEEILKIPNISSCSFYSKEDAMKEYEGLLGEKVADFFQGEGNPLPDAYHVTMSSFDEYDLTVEGLKNIKGVEAISDRSEMAKRLSNFKKIVEIISFWVVISLSAISFLIISNTIRITLHNRRFEISIMKSIGATDYFVRLPFVVEGIVIGVISAAISCLILDIIYAQILNIIVSIAPFRVVPFGLFSKKIFIIFTTTGLIFGGLGGGISVGRYLKKEGGKVAVW